MIISFGNVFFIPKHGTYTINHSNFLFQLVSCDGCRLRIIMSIIIPIPICVYRLDPVKPPKITSINKIMTHALLA